MAGGDHLTHIVWDSIATALDRQGEVDTECVRYYAHLKHRAVISKKRAGATLRYWRDQGMLKHVGFAVFVAA